MSEKEMINRNEKLDSKAMFNFSYGLFVVTARDGEMDNGCIINTAIQLTDEPKRILIALNKQNETHRMIMKTGHFNVSVLTEKAPFHLFRHFGFQSGREVNKFADWKACERTENGIMYINKYTNAVLSARIVDAKEYGTHTVFVAELTQARVLSEDPSATYAYYFSHIKPKPEAKEVKKKGYICKVCGYIYEGEELPEDFICPLCKHGADDFEPLSHTSSNINGSN